MSLNDAHAFGLATTLMAAIIIFQADNGTLAVTTAHPDVAVTPLFHPAEAGVTG